MSLAFHKLFPFGKPAKKQDIFHTAMEKIEALEAKRDYGAVSHSLAELIEKHEDALARAEPFLESIAKTQNISQEKLAHLTERVAEIRNRLDGLRQKFTNISEKIISIEKYKYPETAPISEFSDALSYLKAERKKGNHTTVRHALHELILKHKSALGYGEALIRKYRTLEASNLSVVSVRATKRIESATKTVATLQTRIADLEEMLHELDLEEARKNKEEARIRLERELAEQKKQAETHSKEGKHALAIGLARKLMSEHPQDKSIEKLFHKIEKAFNASIKKEKKAGATE